MKKEKAFGLYGIFGHPLTHTLSPGMQEAAFQKSGLSAFYMAMDLAPADFKKTMQSLSKLTLDGFNLTVPYKETVIPYLDTLTPEAKAVGAVNTVFKKQGRWTGTNTDVYGFLTSLKKEGKFDPKNKNVLVLGAGGASRAVVYALANANCKSICIANRHEGRAQKIVQDFGKIFKKIKITAVSLGNIARPLAECELVVNATSVGLKPGPAVLPDSVIPKAAGTKKLFFDLIYHRETEFMKVAQKKGHRAAGGLGMLLFQGAKAFEHWTGKKAPVDVMDEALKAGLEARKTH